MVQIEVDGSDLILEVLGIHKVWALKSRLAIPLSSVLSVKADSEIASRPKGFRAPGTYIPGIITAGTYYDSGKRIFWDVRKPDNAIVIDLEGAHYAQLIVEVADPDVAIAQIESAKAKTDGAHHGPIEDES